jgi:hypothetical protein
MLQITLLSLLLRLIFLHATLAMPSLNSRGQQFTFANVQYSLQQLQMSFSRTMPSKKLISVAAKAVIRAVRAFAHRTPTLQVVAVFARTHGFD